jgi:hypothetical protein
MQPGRGKQHVGHIRVTWVSTEPLTLVNNNEARCEGFTSVGGFVRYWKNLHGGINWHEPVAVIRFVLAERCPKCAEWEPAL